MSTNPKKGKSAKDSDKKSARKTEESTPVQDRDDDSSFLEHEEELRVITAQNEHQDEEKTEENPPPHEPTPEPSYEEPILTQLIVESYEGEKSRGLYEGEGKAFFKMGHQYVGHFSEGLMHGKGKYTWSSGIVYEGDFVKNKITGKGVYRWPDESTYEGEVLEGKRHGFGTFQQRLPAANENTYDGEVVDGLRKGFGTFQHGPTCISYTGEWVMSQRHGKGRMDYDKEGFSFYEGDWVNNIRHGWGMRQYPSGNIYQGMWYNNIRHGEGTMRWLDSDQMYIGQWEKGIQHGMGQHIWFLRRVHGSQYPLRNMYDGEFRQRMRHGSGSFYYANGARYEGEWEGDKKHGKGKFIFKNGRVYEGMFENDHIREFPNFEMDGVNTPDLTSIRTRTPVYAERVSVHSNESRNTYGPSFQPDFDHLLKSFPEADREEEATQAIFVIIRHITNLRKIYNFYSGLGYEESPDNTFVMNRMQLWRFLKDCRLHHHDITLVQMNRVLAVTPEEVVDMHNPYSKVLFREFTNYLVSLAFLIFGRETMASGPILASCLSTLISDHIIKYSCYVHGYIYFEPRRAVNALVHMDQSYEIFKAFCKPQKHPPYDLTLKMRDLLFLLKDIRIINADLTAKAIVDILGVDDPKVNPEGIINLEVEITFLEFFEALVGCAEVFVTDSVAKDPTTPRPSTTITQEQSLISMPVSPSRGASQMGLDEGAEDITVVTNTSPQPDGLSENGSTQPPSHPRANGSLKPEHTSNLTGVSPVDGGQLVSETVDSMKKSAVTPDVKKSSSFESSHSGTEHQLFQSNVSFGHITGEGGDDNATEGRTQHGSTFAFDEQSKTFFAEEELDEPTRLFNFWTHQVHIFFIHKFCPAAQRLMRVHEIIREKYESKSVDITSRAEA